MGSYPYTEWLPDVVLIVATTSFAFPTMEIEAAPDIERTVPHRRQNSIPF